MENRRNRKDREGRNDDKEEMSSNGRRMREWQHSDLLQALKGEHLSALSSRTERALISVSTVPHCGFN